MKHSDKDQLLVAIMELPSFIKVKLFFDYHYYFLMANWSRKKVMQLAKGFNGRSRNCFGLALRKTHRAAQYAYRDRRVKRRIVRREWIGSINAAVREHGVTYSTFAHALVKKSNI